jgi:hypothetical protein
MSKQPKRLDEELAQANQLLNEVIIDENQN